MRKPCFSFLVACCLLLFTGLNSQHLHAQADSAKVRTAVKVSGEVNKTLTLTKEDLSKMPQKIAILKDRDGKDVSYSGVALQDILELAGVTLGKKLRGENLAKYLLVKCADGYEVIFSLAELDNGFNDKVIILADRMQGGEIPVDKGPFRLIVQGEKVPARSSFQVVELVVGYPKG